MAHGPDGAIGLNGGLPWGYHSEDMKRFRNETIGQAVIMGRVTWESLDKKLNLRHNIVVTSKPKLIDKSQADCATTIEKAIKIADSENIYIIGGAKIFLASLSCVNHYLITEMKYQYDGDTYFKVPFLNEKKLLKEEFWSDDNPKNDCVFREYQNIY